MSCTGSTSGKDLPASARDIRVVGLIPGGEEPLEKEMANTPVFMPGESHLQRSLTELSMQARMHVLHCSLLALGWSLVSVLRWRPLGMFTSVNVQ